MDRLRVSLDLPFDPDPKRWRELLRAIEQWDPMTRSGSLHRLTDPDPPEEEPWTAAREQELITRLAAGEQFAWTMFGTEDSDLGISAQVLAAYVEIGVTVSRPRDPAARLAELLRTLEGGLFPSLAMGWARETDDDELLMQGLHRLADVPPTLFLAGPILDRLGLRSELASVATAIEVVGGLLLAIADPWNPREPEGKRRRRAVGKALGITGGHSVRLLESG